MYESFFRFTSRPFVAAPLVSSYFASESAEVARQTLIRTIDRAEGPGLIVGPAGAGKTLLCRVLAARFQETYQVAMLSSTRILTRKALLQNILFELDQPYRNLEEGELRLSLLDHLQPSDECPNGILLIIDEAHSLPLRLFEEIRMITNLVRDGQPRVRLVMAGSAKLEEKFASPKLESFNQRVAARCYLEPFGRDDTIDYVLSRIAAAGGNADAIFDDGALRAVYQATDGIPRLINQVCDHALVMAFAGGRQQIDGRGIEEAWADLQQLPGPWQDTAATESPGTSIEFGELDGESDFTEVASADTDVEPIEETSALVSVSSDTAFGFSAEESQIDEAVIELQGPSPTIETPASVADPFGDGFDEEEVVIDQAVIQSSEIFANRTRVVSAEGRELSASMLRSARGTDGAIVEELTVSKSEPIEEQSPIERETTVESETETGAEPVSVEAADDVDEHVVPAPTQDIWQSQEAFGAQMFEYTAFEPNSAADLALEALCDVNVALSDLESEYDAPEQPTVKMLDHSDAEVPDGNFVAGEPDAQANDDREIIVVENDAMTAPSTAPEGSVHRVEYQTLFSQLRHG